MLLHHIQSAFLAILTLTIGGHSPWASSYSGPPGSLTPGPEPGLTGTAAAPASTEVPAPGYISRLIQQEATGPAASALIVIPEETSSSETGTVPVERQVSFREFSPESVDYFTEIGLGAEYGDSALVLHKWTEDVRIRVHGMPTSEDIKTLQQVVSELNRLQGSLQLQLNDADSNMDIYFLPEPQFPSVEPGYVPVNLGFFRTWWDHQGAIKRARILIASQGITQQERSHLIREELTQSLGLFKDSWRYPDSVFFQGWTDTTQYSALDADTIRLLYDPRLQPGMTRSEVLGVLSTLNVD